MQAFARQFALMHPAMVLALGAGAVAALWYYRKQHPPLIPGSNVPQVANVQDAVPVPGAIIAGGPDSTPGIPQSDYNAAAHASAGRWAFEPDLSAYYDYTNGGGAPASSPSLLDSIKNFIGA